ncbi:hypothetical protein [Pseudoblastomonas halimionae]|uniref:DUF2029 domain-containing protein n=1 Tax=Alteriqipengyuania halimionae TaxID=1926630 RepID=A0A6I4TZ24_9SPHN|nr:hypothetical protein [Alteriqipengyuania halimionae]MXP08776.1 hypothetical protein [Alteriqipengyuania halimionae]
MTATAPDWDRFGQWGRGPARLMLAVVLLILAIAAVTPPPDSQTGEPAGVPSITGDNPDRPRDDDLTLYDNVVERLQGGEHYYDVIAEEHRKLPFPLKPGLAVRPPTLAYILAYVGEDGMIPIGLVLMALTVWAWWRRFGDEPGGGQFRLVGCALVLVGVSLGLARYFFAMHELWAGILVALALGLHRPGRWGWSFAVLALALAIRETVLPVVLLLGAMAFWRRDWKEGAAWSAVAVLFAVALAVHLHIIAGLARPEDPEGPAWLVLRGLQGWIGNIVLSSNLRWLPNLVSGPLVFLMILGWAGWKTPAGRTLTFFSLGYGLAFMIGGRNENFYWGMVVAPAMFAGLAMAPMALRSIWRSAFPNVSAP